MRHTPPRFFSPQDTPTSNDALLANKDGAKKKGVTLNKKGDVICTVTMLDGHDMHVELPVSVVAVHQGFLVAMGC